MRYSEDSKIKHLSRTLLILIFAGGGYIALQPEYNMAHWTPNQTMRQLGLPYHSILAYEHYMPWVLHFFIALVLTLLLFFSKIYYPEDADKRIASGFVIMVGLILMTEFMQSTIGRNVELSDLVIGLAGTGIATAYLVATQSLKPPS